MDTEGVHLPFPWGVNIPWGVNRMRVSAHAHLDVLPCGKFPSGTFGANLGFEETDDLSASTAVDEGSFNSTHLDEAVAVRVKEAEGALHELRSLNASAS